MLAKTGYKVYKKVNLNLQEKWRSDMIFVLMELTLIKQSQKHFPGNYGKCYGSKAQGHERALQRENWPWPQVSERIDLDLRGQGRLTLTSGVRRENNPERRHLSWRGRRHFAERDGVVVVVVIECKGNSKCKILLLWTILNVFGLNCLLSSRG
jgi:hypothetical protein